MTRPLPLACLVIASAALAAPAGAVIHPGHSIAGVELGMTRAQVRAELGPPARVTRGSNEFGFFRTFRYFRLWVTFQGEETVTAVKTTRQRERTPRGVGIKSTPRPGARERSARALPHADALREGPSRPGRPRHGLPPLRPQGDERARRLRDRLVPHPAIHAGLSPAITRREEPPSPLSRRPALPAGECGPWLGARDREPRRYHLTGH